MKGVAVKQELLMHAHQVILKKNNGYLLNLERT